MKAKLSEAALIVFAFVCLSVIATYPLILHLGRALPADLGDPLFTSWLLGWDTDRLRHGLSGFWDAPILFPSRNATAFSEHMLGIAVIVAPVIWLTDNPILGYDVAFILTYVLAGSGMYLLARELTGRRDAAWLAGLVFGFGPMRALHASHLQVLAWGWMPIALWGLHRYFARRSASALVVFVAAFTMQALSNGYFLYFLALASACVVIYELAVRPASPADRLRMLGGLAAAAIAILVFIAPIAIAYVSARSRYGFRRPYDDWTMFSADVRSYLSVTADIHLWARWLRADGAPERQLFPGLIAVVAGAAALWPGGARRGISILYAVIAAIAFVLSLGPEPAAWSHTLMSSGPFLWFTRIVPGVDGLRAPARLAVLVLLALSVLAALGLARFLATLPPRLRGVAVAVLAVAIFAEGWAAPLRMAPFDSRGRPGDRGAYKWLAQQPPGGVIELPILSWAIAPTLTYQYGTLLHGHPIVNGYSGYGSPLQEFLGGPASPLHDLDRVDQALDLLSAVGVRYVVVHPRDYADPALGVETAAAIRARPTLASEEFRAGEVAAFRLRDRTSEDTPGSPEGHRLQPAEFVAEVSDAADRVPLLFDGDPDTRWLTGREQAGDEWIRIVFDRPRDVSRIELQTAARSFSDYPRELAIDSRGDEGGVATLFHGPMLVPFGRALAIGSPRPALTIPLPPNQTRTLTIRQTGRTRRWFWSVHELGIWTR